MDKLEAIKMICEVSEGLGAIQGTLLGVQAARRRDMQRLLTEIDKARGLAKRAQCVMMDLIGVLFETENREEDFEEDE